MNLSVFSKVWRGYFGLCFVCRVVGSDLSEVASILPKSDDSPASRNSRVDMIDNSLGKVLVSPTGTSVLGVCLRRSLPFEICESQL